MKNGVPSVPNTKRCRSVQATGWNERATRNLSTTVWLRALHHPFALSVSEGERRKPAPPRSHARCKARSRKMGNLPPHMHRDEMSKTGVNSSFIRRCDARKASQGDLEAEKKWKVQKQLPHKKRVRVALTDWKAIVLRRLPKLAPRTLGATVALVGTSLRYSRGSRHVGLRMSYPICDDGSMNSTRSSQLHRPNSRVARI
jgi:hypothetical protein